MPAFRRAARQRDEEEEERNRQTVIEAGFHVQGLANFHRHAWAVHDDLPEPGIGRRENGGQDARFPNGELAKHDERSERAQHNGQEHARAQETGRQAPNVPQDAKIDAAGIGKEQQHEANLGDVEEHCETALPLPQLRQEKESQHARGGEQDGRGQDCALESPGNQAVEKDERDESSDEVHNSKTHTHRKDPGRFILIQIEDVGRKIHFLIGETHEKSALDIDAALVGPRALADQTKSKPIHGRDA